MTEPSYIDLDHQNAGVVAMWLTERGIPATVRGGPWGGSIDATVIVNQGGKLIVEPGDRVRVLNGEVWLS